jgi:hypothetical protein
MYAATAAKHLDTPAQDIVLDPVTETTKTSVVAEFRYYASEFARYSDTSTEYFIFDLTSEASTVTEASFLACSPADPEHFDTASAVVDIDTATKTAEPIIASVMPARLARAT